MKITRKITDKMLCFRSDLTGVLHDNGLASKLTSETYYGRTIYNNSKFGSGFHSLYIASVDTRTKVNNNIYFKLLK